MLEEEASMREVHQMKNSHIKWGGGRPKKTLG